MFDVRIKSLTKKLKTLFRVQDKSLEQDCKIYKGVGSCGKSYIAETIKNVEVRWNEHSKSKVKSAETH